MPCGCHAVGIPRVQVRTGDKQARVPNSYVTECERVVYKPPAITSSEKKSRGVPNIHHYRRQKLLGKGNFGKVYVARGPDGADYAIKEMDMSGIGQKLKERAIWEVKVTSEASGGHPFIVDYVEAMCERQTVYIVMEYAAGGNLKSKLETQIKAGKLWSEWRIRRYMLEILLAVKGLHDNHILHRDMKTENIFLTENDDVKLGDFGLARALNAFGQTSTYAVTSAGTPGYIAPEILMNQRYDHKADIWSVGVILYELASGRLPFHPNNRYSVINQQHQPLPGHLTTEFRQIVNNMLRKNPHGRPSVDELLQTSIMRDTFESQLTPEQHRLFDYTGRFLLFESRNGAVHVEEITRQIIGSVRQLDFSEAAMDEHEARSREADKAPDAPAIPTDFPDAAIDMATTPTRPSAVPRRKRDVIYLTGPNAATTYVDPSIAEKVARDIAERRRRGEHVPRGSQMTYTSYATDPPTILTFSVEAGDDDDSWTEYSDDEALSSECSFKPAAGAPPKVKEGANSLDESDDDSVAQSSLLSGRDSFRAGQVSTDTIVLTAQAAAAAGYRPPRRGGSKRSDATPVPLSPRSEACTESCTEMTQQTEMTADHVSDSEEAIQERMLYNDTRSALQRLISVIEAEATAAAAAAQRSTPPPQRSTPPPQRSTPPPQRSTPPPQRSTPPPQRSPVGTTEVPAMSKLAEPEPSSSLFAPFSPREAARKAAAAAAPGPSDSDYEDFASEKTLEVAPSPLPLKTLVPKSLTTSDDQASSVHEAMSASGSSLAASCHAPLQTLSPPGPSDLSNSVAAAATRAEGAAGPSGAAALMRAVEQVSVLETVPEERPLVIETPSAVPAAAEIVISVKDETVDSSALTNETTNNTTVSTSQDDDTSASALADASLVPDAPANIMDPAHALGTSVEESSIGGSAVLGLSSVENVSSAVVSSAILGADNTGLSSMSGSRVLASTPEPQGRSKQSSNRSVASKLSNQDRTWRQSPRRDHVGGSSVDRSSPKVPSKGRRVNSLPTNSPHTTIVSNGAGSSAEYSTTSSSSEDDNETKATVEEEPEKPATVVYTLPSVDGGPPTTVSYTTDPITQEATVTYTNPATNPPTIVTYAINAPKAPKVREATVTGPHDGAAKHPKGGVSVESAKDTSVTYRNGLLERDPVTGGLKVVGNGRASKKDATTVTYTNLATGTVVTYNIGSDQSFTHNPFSNTFKRLAASASPLKTPPAPTLAPLAHATTSADEESDDGWSQSVAESAVNRRQRLLAHDTPAAASTAAPSPGSPYVPHGHSPPVSGSGSGSGQMRGSATRMRTVTSQVISTPPTTRYDTKSSGAYSGVNYAASYSTSTAIPVYGGYTTSDEDHTDLSPMDAMGSPRSPRRGVVSSASSGAVLPKASASTASTAAPGPAPYGRSYGYIPESAWVTRPKAYSSKTLSSPRPGSYATYYQ